jgi:hypothetical protein
MLSSLYLSPLAGDRSLRLETKVTHIFLSKEERFFPTQTIWNPTISKE